MEKNSRILSKNKGMGLVAVVVFMGVYSVVTYILIVTMNLLVAKNKKFDLTYDVQSLKQDLSLSLGSIVSCTANFQSSNVVLPTTKLTLDSIRITNSTGSTAKTIISSIGSIYSSNTGLRISQATLTNVTQVNPNIYVADLVVSLAHNVRTVPAIQPYVIDNVRLVTDSTGHVTGCTSNVKLTCATGFIRANAGSTFTTGKKIVNNSDSRFESNFDNIFGIHSGSTTFGLYCKNNWYVAGCMMSGLEPAAGSVDAVLDDSIRDEGCLAFKSSIPSPAPNDYTGIYETCCIPR